MAQQEGGWPLGLQSLNVSVGRVRNRYLNGSVSFNTLLSGSPTSSIDTTSDSETESTGSFFHEMNITLGSLIGASSTTELSRRSARGRTSETIRDKKHYKPKTWLFSICSKMTTDDVTMSNNTPSLGHFLQAERKAATIYRRNQSPITSGPDSLSHILPASCPSLPFVSGNISPPDQSSPWMSSGSEGRSNKSLFDHGDGYGTPLLSCLRGN